MPAKCRPASKALFPLLIASGFRAARGTCNSSEVGCVPTALVILQQPTNGSVAGSALTKPPAVQLLLDGEPWLDASLQASWTRTAYSETTGQPFEQTELRDLAFNDDATANLTGVAFSSAGVRKITFTASELPSGATPFSLSIVSDPFTVLPAAASELLIAAEPTGGALLSFPHHHLLVTDNDSDRRRFGWTGPVSGTHAASNLSEATLQRVAD